MFAQENAPIDIEVMKTMPLHHEVGEKYFENTEIAGTLFGVADNWEVIVRPMNAGFELIVLSEDGKNVSINWFSEVTFHTEYSVYGHSVEDEDSATGYRTSFDDPSYTVLVYITASKSHSYYLPVPDNAVDGDFLFVVDDKNILKEVYQKYESEDENGDGEFSGYVALRAIRAVENTISINEEKLKEFLETSGIEERMEAEIQAKEKREKLVADQKREADRKIAEVRRKFPVLDKIKVGMRVDDPTFVLLKNLNYRLATYEDASGHWEIFTPDGSNISDSCLTRFCWMGIWSSSCMNVDENERFLGYIVVAALNGRVKYIGDIELGSYKVIE
jgi:hypothetical protein